ncbi:hypothetical protein [Aeromonas bestiarum]|nr:hypothetical protein [Aeromonas bestiarum]
MHRARYRWLHIEYITGELVVQLVVVTDINGDRLAFLHLGLGGQG